MDGMLLLNIALAAVMVLMVIRLWPAFKAWQEHGPRAGKGDWEAVVLPLALVAGLVMLLVLMVH